ncbi:MAG: hypothetical protein H6779_01220 [Candidatus Nomurabacteria bacterium]|nr:hypothetical protein [Candidatus Nomurabacteria bacterium]USN88050.1 MAG: hypothetical protein H6779_01220 [Candidatus Nomurabacteria bacterium]
MIDTSLATLPLHTIITTSFYLVLITYIVFTAILYYHWNEYSVEPTVTRTTYVFYFASTLPLILILSITALII